MKNPYLHQYYPQEHVIQACLLNVNGTLTYFCRNDINNIITSHRVEQKQKDEKNTDTDNAL